MRVSLLYGRVRHHYRSQSNCGKYQTGFFLDTGMASPLIGIAGVNSLLFTSYAISKRMISPFPDLSLKEIAAAGAMAGAANSILASPGKSCL